jgi:hypothetical protein
MNTGPYRDGHLLVVEEGMAMPPRCPKCNAPAADEPLPVRFIARRGNGLGQKLVVAIADRVRGWNYTGPVDVDMYFCPRHRARKQQWAVAFILMIAIGGLITALSIASGSKPFNQLPDTEKAFRTVGVALFMIGVLCGVMMMGGHFSPWRFVPKHFDDREVWVDGVSQEFLGTLPCRAPGQAATKKAA